MNANQKIEPPKSDLKREYLRRYRVQIHVLHATQEVATSSSPGEQFNFYGLISDRTLKELAGALDIEPNSFCTSEPQLRGNDHDDVGQKQALKLVTFVHSVFKARTSNPPYLVFFACHRLQARRRILLLPMCGKIVLLQTF